jgi:IclR family pca regulon transcriptional regulator
LSEAFLSSVSMQEVLQQYLQEPVETTGDSASVAILDGPDVLHIASVPVRRSFQLTPTIGTRYPAYAPSLGRVVLSRSSSEVVEKVLAASRPTQVTANTITDDRRLREVIAQARTNGIVGTDEELAYG